jgi:hypothetical protein
MRGGARRGVGGDLMMWHEYDAAARSRWVVDDVANLDLVKAMFVSFKTHFRTPKTTENRGRTHLGVHLFYCTLPVEWVFLTRHGVGNCSPVYLGLAL